MNIDMNILYPSIIPDADELRKRLEDVFYSSVLYRGMLLRHVYSVVGF